MRWNPPHAILEYTKTLNNILSKTITDFKLKPKPCEGTEYALILFERDPPVSLSCDKKWNGVDKKIYLAIEQTVKTLTESERLSLNKSTPLTIIGYQYMIRLHEQGGPWLIFHYESQKKGYCKCHLHLKCMTLPRPEGTQTVYSCPAHPRITSRYRGNCYQCGLPTLPLGQSIIYPKLHIPTGRVSLEHLIIFLVSDMQVKSKLSGQMLFDKLFETFKEYSEEAQLGVL